MAAGAARGLLASIVLIAALLASLADWNAGASAASPPDAAVEEVRRAYAACRDIRKHATAVQVYQRRSGNPPVRRWERARPPDPEGTGRAMSLFTVERTVRAAIEEVDPRSGDWRQTVEHCFRPDGSVAFVLAVLRTFQGNVQVEDRMYFNPAGERIRTLRRVSDLTTEKPLKRDEASFMGRKPTIYRSVNELLRTVGRDVVFPSSGSK